MKESILSVVIPDSDPESTTSRNNLFILFLTQEKYQKNIHLKINAKILLHSDKRK